MKKLMAVSCLAVMLSGCINNSKELDEEQKVDEVTYVPNTALKIAVVGNEKLTSIENVSYQERELSYVSNNSKESFDALIITKSAFKDADQEQYVDFFNTVSYPVFFIGTENLSLSAFTNKNTTIEQAKINQDAYTKGYLNPTDSNEEIKKWSFHLPDNPTDKDKNEKMLTRIVEEIDKLE